MKKVELLTFETLIENESFQKWVTTDRVFDNNYWQTQIQSKPSQQKLVEDAATFIMQFQFKKQQLPESDIQFEWDKLEKRITQSEDTHSTGKVISMKRRSWFSAAAAILLLVVSASAFFFFNQKESLIVKKTDFGERLDIGLSDASSIKLNANSEISFLKKWKSSETRVVSLEGQAFFDVNSLSSKTKFKVKTDRFTVEVLGTEFDVTSRADKASVVLKEGKINIVFNKKTTVVSDGKTKEVEKILLLPDDYLRLVGNKYYKTKINTANYIAWTEKKLVLDVVSLDDIGHVIKDLYGYEIEFASDKLKTIEMTGSIPMDNFEELIVAIENVYKIKVEKISESRLKFVKQ